VSFYTDVIKKDHRFGSLDTINDLALLEPKTREAVQAILSEGAAMGVHMRVLETYRSQARQHLLFTRGATQLKVVGCHGYGIAADIGIMTVKGMDPDGAHYDVLRRLAEKNGLISGSDWGEPEKPHNFRDYDHVQRIAVKRQESVFDGSWYPDANYDPLVDLGRK
jgi:hypothetical protein